MIKSIIAQLNNAVTKYKAQRVVNVINSYAAVIDGTLKVTLPTVLSFYKQGASVVVNKTYEDPQPMLNLLKALDEVNKHYGPALTYLVTQLKANLEDIEVNGAFGHDLLADDIDAMLDDVRV